MTHNEPRATHAAAVDLAYARRSRTLPRWLRRTLWVLLVVGIGYLLYPHGFNRADITFTCGLCQGQVDYHRIEAIPPRWLLFKRYAGWTWKTTDPAAKKLDEECDHFWNVRAQAEMRMGKVSGSGTRDSGADPLYMNSHAAVPQNAEAILDELMSPGNHGISIGPAPYPMSN